MGTQIWHMAIFEYRGALLLDERMHWRWVVRDSGRYFVEVSYFAVDEKRIKSISKDLERQWAKIGKKLTAREGHFEGRLKIFLLQPTRPTTAELTRPILSK